jgi:hypothetical protein
MTYIIIIIILIITVFRYDIMPNISVSAPTSELSL